MVAKAPHKRALKQPCCLQSLLTLQSSLRLPTLLGPDNRAENSREWPWPCDASSRDTVSEVKALLDLLTRLRAAPRIARIGQGRAGRASGDFTDFTWRYTCMPSWGYSRWSCHRILRKGHVRHTDRIEA